MTAPLVERSAREFLNWYQRRHYFDKEPQESDVFCLVKVLEHVREPLEQEIELRTAQLERALGSGERAVNMVREVLADAILLTRARGRMSGVEHTLTLAMRWSYLSLGLSFGMVLAYAQVWGRVVGFSLVVAASMYSLVLVRRVQKRLGLR